MNKKKNATKIPYDFHQKVEKTSLTRLAGIVTGARMNLVAQRGFLLKYLPPFLIAFIYFQTSLPFFNIFFVLSYTAGSVIWYLIIRKITGRVFIALMTMLFWISPLFSIDIKDLYIVVPSHLYLAFFTFDTAHIIGLFLSPIPLYFLLSFLKKPVFNSFIYSIIGFSFIFLISPFSMMNLLIIATVFTFSEVLIGEGRVKLLRYILVVIISILLSSFWYHPQFILDLIASSQWKPTIATFTNLIPLLFFLIPISGTILFLIFDRKPQLQVLFISIVLVIIYTLIYFSENVLTIKVIPLPERFKPELSLSLSLLLSIILSNLNLLTAVIVIKLRRHTNKWFERIPYWLSSFVAGYIATWSIMMLWVNYSVIRNIDPNHLRSGLVVTFDLSKWLLSRFLGMAITLLTVLFLLKIRKNFLSSKNE